MNAENAPTENSRRLIHLQLGRLVATPGAIAAMTKAGQDPALLLDRHRHGEWGDVSPSDRESNDQAVTQGERILSAYPLGGGGKLWIITEADRSATTLLLPEEY